VARYLRVLKVVVQYNVLLFHKLVPDWQRLGRKNRRRKGHAFSGFGRIPDLQCIHRMPGRFGRSQCANCAERGAKDTVCVFHGIPTCTARAADVLFGHVAPMGWTYVGRRKSVSLDSLVRKPRTARGSEERRQTGPGRNPEQVRNFPRWVRPENTHLASFVEFAAEFYEDSCYGAAYAAYAAAWYILPLS
jgi:hypothetical protein